MLKKIVTGLLVVAVVAGLAAAGVWQVRLFLQRRAYEAGHTAYQRANCAAALPRLADAHGGDLLDPHTARQAAADARACRHYEQVRAATARQSSEAAVNVWTTYIVSETSRPLADGARRQARQLIGQSIDSEALTLTFCAARQRVVTAEVVRLVPADTLAPRLLDACAHLLLRDNQTEEARVAFAQLQATFPRSREAKRTFEELISLSGTIGRHDRYALPTRDFWYRSGTDRTLKGRARVTIINSTRWPLDMSAAGHPATFTHVPGCENCWYGTNLKTDCTRAGRPSRTLTIPAGTYPIQFWFMGRDEPRLQDLMTGTVTVKPNGVYKPCFWMKPHR